MTIAFTKHALSVIQERRLDKAFVELAVQSPDWKEAGQGDVWSGFKRTSGKVLRVVVRGQRDPFTVITAYYDRRKK